MTLTPEELPITLLMDELIKGITYFETHNLVPTKISRSTGARCITIEFE